MKRWARRLAYLVALLLWLSVMSLPLLAVVVARQGEFRLGQEQGSHLRLFLVQEPGANGLGLAWTRQVRGADSCRHTSVRYLMWQGTGESASFCQCLGPDGSVTAANCPPG